MKRRKGRGSDGEKGSGNRLFFKEGFGVGSLLSGAGSVSIGDFVGMVEGGEEGKGIKAVEIVKYLMRDHGVLLMNGVNDVLTTENVRRVVEGYKISERGAADVKGDGNEEDDDEEGSGVNGVSGSSESSVDTSKMYRRPPIVTVLGHVDHGKTTLLDRLLTDYDSDTTDPSGSSISRITEGEVGGITQNVMCGSIVFSSREEDDDDDEEGEEDEESGESSSSSSSSSSRKKTITIVDTPGHAAFGGIRDRGCGLADVVVLVVSLVDGVNAQTRDSIRLLSRDGGSRDVPVVVAMNKVDLVGEGEMDRVVDRVAADLSEEGLLVENLGGEVQCQVISALVGTGVDELMEKVLLEARVNSDLWVPRVSSSSSPSSPSPRPPPRSSTP